MRRTFRKTSLADSGLPRRNPRA